MQLQTDVVIAGAGVIGMTLALELRQRGRQVLLLERGTAASGASRAAAGMLAVHDPSNPPALRPLAELSRSLYPALLQTLSSLAPTHPVPFETNWTLEQTGGPARNNFSPLPVGLLAGGRHFALLEEASIDPRRLTAALCAALKKAGVRMLEGAQARPPQLLPSGRLRIDTASVSVQCARFVDCTGAWSGPTVRPIKGQMLRVRLDGHTPTLPGRGNIVLRTPDVYIVPRLDGTAVIGSTLEDKGFCIKTKEAAIFGIRDRAASLYAPVRDASEVERWAGVRPTTTDFLPILGILPGGPGPNAFVAGGHFRNGILLAPGTAHVMAQLLCDESTSIPLQPFSPTRFPSASSTR